MNLRDWYGLILPACAGAALAVMAVKVADLFASYVVKVFL